MRTDDFLKAIRHQRAEVPVVRSPAGVGLGADGDQYETTVSDPARTARMIVAAAKIRDTGGTETPKISSTAQAILAAGRKRRSETPS